MTPNEHQLRKREQLRKELGRATPLPSSGMSLCGYDLTAVDGVTVVITKSSSNTYDRGGYKVAAVRTYDEKGYPTSLDAAVKAKELFAKQRERDGRNLESAKKLRKGHLGPIVNTDWYCNNEDCPCQKEDAIDRRRDRSLKG
jgi:hypothetical protein